MDANQLTKTPQLDFVVTNKIVLLRTDYNLPIKNGVIENDMRLRASLPIIRSLLENGARKIVILSHMGRPEGVDLKLSLKTLLGKLEALLGLEVAFASDLEELKSLILGKERLILLENLRFWAGEGANSVEFARQVVEATGAELFVQDGFGVAHRQTATTVAITKLLPSYASPAFKQEYRLVGGFLQQSPRPLLAIIGGAKISDKIDFLLKLAQEVDYLFIGGAMANVFLAEAGYQLGRSLTEANQMATVQAVYQAWRAAAKAPECLILPRDVHVTTELGGNSFVNKTLEQLGPDDIIADIGDETIVELRTLLDRAGAIVWNGNLGYSENPLFARGTEVLAEAIVSGRQRALIGGGDTAGYVDNFTTEFLQKNSGELNPNLFLSTGGGASLELLAYGQLAGAEGLLNL